VSFDTELVDIVHAAAGIGHLASRAAARS
jgi:hypothetical protein